MKKAKLIAITGGIGAGKSVVSSILRTAGYGVYDCDQRARELMNTLPSIKDALIERFSPEIYIDGELNRKLLSDIIFNDSEALTFVNNIVHPKVREDIMKWFSNQKKDISFVETAILKEGGIDKMVDSVWNVTAPLETRIKRVMARNGIPREKVIERINSQQTDLDCDRDKIVEIVNDGTTALLPQIFQVLKKDS